MGSNAKLKRDRRQLTADDKALHRAHKRVRGRSNAYLRTLVDPAVKGVRIPDNDVQETGTSHARAVITPTVVTDGASTYYTAAVISPAIYDSLVETTVNSATINWTSTTSTVQKTQWMAASVSSQYENIATGVRVVSAELEVEYIAPALNAKGQFVLACVDPTQAIAYSSANKTFFDGTILNGSQLKGSVVCPVGQGASVRWHPYDDSSNLYCPVDPELTTDIRAFRGFHQTSADLVAASEPASTSSDFNECKIPFFYFAAHDLDSTAAFQLTLTVNYEFTPRNAQIDMGYALSISDQDDYEHAKNVSNMFPQALPTTDMNGNALSAKHPATALKSIARSEALSLSGAKTPAQHQDVKSGRSFLKRAWDKLKGAAAEYLPKLGEELLELI